MKNGLMILSHVLGLLLVPSVSAQDSNIGFEFSNVGQVSSLNTEESEFGGYAIEDDRFYFCTSSSLSQAIEEIDESTNKSLYNMYVVESNEDSFSTPKIIEKFRGIHAGPVCMIPGKDIMFVTANLHRQKDGKNMLKLYRTEVSKTYSIGDLTELSLNSLDYSVGHPAVSKDGKTLYFASDMPGGFGGVDLYQVGIDENGDVVGSPQNLGSSVNSSGDDFFPWVGNDGLLFYSSNGHGGMGKLDLFVTYSDANNEVWQSPMNLGGSINSKDDDFALVLNADNTSGFYSSNRKDGPGSDDIYAFDLKSTFIKEAILASNGDNNEGSQGGSSSDNMMATALASITDRETGEPLEGVTVTIIDAQTGEVLAEEMTSSSGTISKELIEKTVGDDLSYKVEVSKDGYQGTSGTYDGTMKSSGAVNLNEQFDLALVPLDQSGDTASSGSNTSENGSNEDSSAQTQMARVLASITDRETGKALEGVMVKILDAQTGEVLAREMTNSSGTISKELIEKTVGDDLSYKVEVSKDGYTGTSGIYDGTMKSSGEVNLNEQFDLALVPVNNGEVASTIVVNTIYFDFAKYEIRPDARMELDKMVKILNENPDWKLELSAHTDCRATSGHNQRLSERRAQACVGYIKSKITNPSRVSGKGYGETRLLNNCGCGDDNVGEDCSEAEHQKNRRTEFKLIANSSSTTTIKYN